jgi:putative hemolysin
MSRPPPVLQLDEILDRFPAVRPFRRLIVRLAGRALMLDRFSEDIIDWAADEGFSATLDGLLQLHGVSVHVAHGDPVQLARPGPLIVVSNHPLGLLDAMAITALGERQGRPPRILASDFLARVQPVRKHLIAVDNFSTSKSLSANALPLRAAAKHLEAGGSMVTFPANRVSHFRFASMKVEDRPWQDHVVRLARMTGASVLPVRVLTSNGAGYHAAGAIFGMAAMMLLLRQLYRIVDGAARVDVSIGQPLPAEAFVGGKPAIARAAQLRAMVYALPG